MPARIALKQIRAFVNETARAFANHWIFTMTR